VTDFARMIKGRSRLDSLREVKIRIAARRQPPGPKHQRHIVPRDFIHRTKHPSRRSRLANVISPKHRGNRNNHARQTHSDKLRAMFAKTFQS